MTATLSYLSLALYVVSLALYSWYLFQSRRVIGRFATAFLAGGIVFHYVSLWMRAKAVGSVPYQDQYGSMSLFAWFLAVTYLGLERFHRQRAVGPVVLPIILLLICLSTIFSPSTPPRPPTDVRGPLFALHVTSNILAYAAFSLSFVMSLIYLAQNRILRRRKPGPVIWQFPALEVLERMSRNSVIVGVCALAFGLTLGLIWNRRIHQAYLTGDLKEIISFVILLAYFSYLWLSRTAEWRGARAAFLCVFNFLVVLFSYTIVNFYLSQFHRFW
jgi:ABC-type uncharacterized transport system permease subunit